MEVCTKAFHGSICWQGEGLAGVIIFEYGFTGNFFLDGMKCLSMFRSPYKWYIFLVSSLKLSPSFCQS